MSETITVNNCTVISGPDLSTLPNRMCYAAGVLEEATRKYHGASREAAYVDWRPVSLRSVAIQFEREDAAVAEREAHVEDLARAIRAAFNPYADFAPAPYLCDFYRTAARRLIDAGWSKSILQLL